MKTIKGYKFVTSKLKSRNGVCTWKIGEWKQEKKKITLCERGFHACIKPKHVFEYIYGDRLFVVEAKGKIIQGDNKFVASEMRLIKELPTKEIAVQYAIKCAWHTLQNYENKYPNDKRVPQRVPQVPHGVPQRVPQVPQ